jgi:DNA processing protein
LTLAEPKRLMERHELDDWLRLTLTPGIGNATARKLMSAFGLPQTVFEQRVGALRQVVSEDQAAALRTTPAELSSLLELTWKWLQESGDGSARRQIVVLGESDYPASFLTLDDPPLMLYLLGSGHLVTDAAQIGLINSIAVVGSRNPTPQGAANARHFSKALGEAGLTVVSGLALGIDGAAHEGALDSVEPGSERLATVAVVGTGLDRVYPKAHRDLAHRIARHGLLVSEYPLGTPPLTANFPRRNRLIAGLAQGTLVVEAALKSGSLITARLTAEQGKEVFAIPGSIHSTQTRGCHALIKQGAKLVESAQDVLEELKIEVKPPLFGTTAVEGKVPDGADNVFGSAHLLLEVLGFDPVGLDTLQARSQLDTANLQAQLMSLELAGWVERLPGGLFQRVTPN